MTIGNVMRVAAVLGAAVAGGASATSQSQSCPPGQLCGPQPAQLKQAGLPVRAGAVKTETAVDGVIVQARAGGVAGWDLGIKNETDKPILMVWDESSFVMSNSQSAGRLLRGETRKIDSGKSQPPTPIPPGVALSQYVIAEKFTAEDEYEGDVAERNNLGFNDSMIASIEGRRALREKAINGGKLYLVIDVGGEKKTWIGVVEVRLLTNRTAVEETRGTRPLYCAGKECWFDETKCLAAGPVCDKRRGGACFTVTEGSDKRQLCAPTVDDCAERRSKMTEPTLTVGACEAYAVMKGW